jgi:hypothetical protein
MTLAEKMAVFFGVGTASLVAGGLWWSIASTNVSTELEDDPTLVQEAPFGEAERAARRERAEKSLRTEPQISDLVWSGPFLYVGMLDDGGRRDGYAGYVCEVLREHHAEAGVTVIIKDFAKMVGHGEHVKLGEARC